MRNKDLVDAFGYFFLQGDVPGKAIQDCMRLNVPKGPIRTEVFLPNFYERKLELCHEGDQAIMMTAESFQEGWRLCLSEGRNVVLRDKSAQCLVEKIAPFEQIEREQGGALEYIDSPQEDVPPRLLQIPRLCVRRRIGAVDRTCSA